LPATLIALFARYGYFVVFGAVLLENAGVPSPGHTVMLGAGALAQQGHLSLPIVIAIGVLAAILGDNIGYLIGRRGGRALLLRHGRRFLLTPESIRKAERFFDRHGAKTVFVGRFITGLQTLVALLAGAHRMSWKTFFLWNVLGAIAWSAVYAGLGYAFGASWNVLDRWVGDAGLFLLALLCLGLAVLAVRHRKSIARQSERVLPSALYKRQAALGLIVLGCAAIFIKIADEVTERETTHLDRAVSLGLHSLDSPALDALMKTFTFVGSFPAVVVVSLAVLGWSWQRNDKVAFVGILGVMLIDESLNAVLKKIFERPRPTLFQGIATLHSYSFPSGHAMAAASIYGMLAVVVARLRPQLGRFTITLAVVLAFMIGLSRIYLGVHWLTDVLAGYAVGSAILFCGILWLELCHSRWWARH
jgi:undecaprenyl-diphosphatase